MLELSQRRPETAVSIPHSKEALDPAAKSARVDRRQSRRYCTALQVNVLWVDEARVVRECSGTLRDVSAGGFCVEVDSQIAVGQTVTVRMVSATLECVVRHVRVSQRVNLVGLEALPSSRPALNALERINIVLDSLHSTEAGV